MPRTDTPARIKNCLACQEYPNPAGLVRDKDGIPIPDPAKTTGKCLWDLKAIPHGEHGRYICKHFNWRQP